MSNKCLTLNDLDLDTLDPKAFLESSLTEDEAGALHNIKHELGICIRWGALTDNMFEWLMSGMDGLVFLENEKSSTAVVKSNPYAALFDRDKKRISGDQERTQLARKYVLLHLLKKLLGSLKTRVNQEFEGIEIIDEEAEAELKAILAASADEEEMDLAGETDLAAGEREIVARITAGEERGCNHNHVTVRQIRADQSRSGTDELHQYCKDCRQVIQKDILKSITKTKRRFLPDILPKTCPHSRVQWLEGQEGRVAICSSCKEKVPDPQTYHWTKVGLEPFGDDPQQDEFIRVPARKQESAV